jgi:hypothetical protein
MMTAVVVWFILTGCLLLQHFGRSWIPQYQHIRHPGGPAPSCPFFAAVSETVPTSLLTQDINRTSYTRNKKEDVTTAWDILADNMAACLIASDLKRDSGFDGSSTGWTSWVEESSAFRLQKCIDNLVFCDSSKTTSLRSTTALNGVHDNKKAYATLFLDGTIRWLNWMKTSPSPMLLELSEDLRISINNVMSEKDYQRIEQSPQDFLSRISCRVLLMPSGKTLHNNLQSPPGAMVYGKLLYGGVTRYRILGNTANSKRPQRKAGERTVIAPPPSGETLVPTEAWVS